MQIAHYVELVWGKTSNLKVLFFRMEDILQRYFIIKKSISNELKIIQSICIQVAFKN